VPTKVRADEPAELQVVEKSGSLAETTESQDTRLASG
jgi:hypothetical protein